MKCESQAECAGIHSNQEGGNHHQARHTEKRSEDTYQTLWLGQPRAREGGGVNCCTDA